MRALYFALGVSLLAGCTSWRGTAHAEKKQRRRPPDRVAAFERFLARYRASGATRRAALARAFIKRQRTRGGFPIVHPDGRAVFLYLGTGAEKSVHLVGDFKARSFYNVYWDERGVSMSRAAGAALHIKQLKFEGDARLDYQFVVDGKRRRDPLNPRVIFNGIAGGEASELVMPRYKRSAVRAPGARGTLRVLEQAWAKPRVTIYLPPGYDPSRRYAVIYTADGSAWVNYVKLPQILDSLIAAKTIVPAIAVMIDPTEDRSAWYYFNSAYLAYLEQVIAHIDRRYSTIKHARGRLHLGSSAGGRITLHVGLERPGMFRNIAMLSPSLSGPPHYYEAYFSGRRKPPKSLKIWLSAGTYEGYIYRDTRTMERYFKKVGLETKTAYTHEGHSFGTWRNITPAVLRYFLGVGQNDAT